MYIYIGRLVECGVADCIDRLYWPLDLNIKKSEIGKNWYNVRGEENRLNLKISNNM